MMFEKTIRRVKRDLLLTVVASAALYVAYQVLLDKQAKEDIREAVTTISDAGRQLATLVNEQIGTIMDEEVIAENRQQVRDAWQALGY